MRSRLNQIVKVALVIAVSAGFVACSGKKKKAPIGSKKTRTTDPAKRTPVTTPASIPASTATATLPQAVIPTASNPQTSVIIRGDGTQTAEMEKVTEVPAVIVSGSSSAPVAIVKSNGATISPGNGPVFFPTGAVDVKRRAFSDSSIDTLLPILKAEVDNLPDQLREDSEAFSLAIRSVSVEANERNRKVIAEIIFSGPDGPVSAKFIGGLDVNNRAIMEEHPDTAGDEFIFKATVACVDDNDESCENTVIRIDQYTNGNEICKTAYAVHRMGNVHVQFNMRDFARYKNSENPMLKDFVHYLKNTHDAVQKVNACRRTGRTDCKTVPMLAPAAAEVEFRSFAVAYGQSAFTLTFWSIRTVKQQDEDVLILSGPLMLSDDVSSTKTDLGIGGFMRQTNGTITNDQGKYEGYFSRANLLTNDGNGNLTVLHLNDPRGEKGEAVSTMIYVTSEVLEARDFMYLLKNPKP